MPASSPEAADRAACRALMRGGSKTFFAAAHLLPRRVYEPATALYAFCRLADDMIDDAPVGDRDARRAALERLGLRLDRAYAGVPCDHPADRAFAGAVMRHHIPRTLPLALLEGFAWDADGRRYRTLDDVLDYAARVAGSVGAMMAVLMGARSRPALARACDLGVAMQLTNIARDVGEDARAGRLYLPLDWLEDAGVSAEAFLAAPVFSPALAQVIERVLLTADRLYAQATTGIGTLPLGCRPGITAARLIYAEIGGVLACGGFDSVSRRAHVSAGRKATLLGRSLLPTRSAVVSQGLPALPACRYLVEAVMLDSPARRTPARALEARIHWVLDLFERLHAQQWETS